VLAEYQARVRLARNGEFVGNDARFTDADEIALIPPVSGG
jgi:molybdopterin converting factor small subunit